MAGNIYDWSITPGNNGNADGDINWAENQLPSTVNNSARQMMARHAEYLSDIAPIRVSTGAANTYNVTVSSVLTTYDNGLIIAFRAHQSPTGASQINVNGLGLKPIRLVSGVAMPSGAFPIGAAVSAVYITVTDEFLVLSGAQNAFGYTPVNKAGDTMTGALSLFNRSVVSKSATDAEEGGTLLFGAPTNGGLATSGVQWYSDDSWYFFSGGKGFRIDNAEIPAAQYPRAWHELNPASQAEAETGTNNLKGMTPLRTAQHVSFRAASQAEMEAASSVTQLATPGRQHFHPSALKSWGKAGNTANILGTAYNVSSVTDNGAGDATWNWTTAYSSANYAAVSQCLDNVAGERHAKISNQTTSSVRTEVRNSAGALTDPTSAHFVLAAGDL